jgi:hypothetical protein
MIEVGWHPDTSLALKKAAFFDTYTKHLKSFEGME